MSTESDESYIEQLKRELNWQHDVVIPALESQYCDALTYVIELLDIIEGNSKIENIVQYMKDLRYYIDDHLHELNGCGCTDSDSDDLPF